MRYILTIAFALVVTGGCDTAPAPVADDTVSEMDSAGFRIVTNRAPQWSGGSKWRVDSVPDLEIGAADGAEEESFHGIVVVRATNDGILVAQTTDVRLFDNAGAFVAGLGGAGAGPGEFTRIAAALTCDDQIVVSELTPPRLTIFDAARRPRTVSLPAPESQGFLNPLQPLYACTRTGVIGGMSGPRATATPPAVQRQPALIVHVTEAETVDTLFTYPGMETYSGLMVPFGRQTLVAVRDTLLYVADTGAAQIRVATFDDHTKHVVRLAMPAREVTSADVERIREQYLGGLSPGVRAEVQPRFEAAQMPATMPHFSRLLVAPDYTVWLQAYQPFRAESQPRWTVIDAGGRWLGDVTLPRDLTVHEFGNDYVLGVWRNEDGVEFVRRYRIRR